MDAALARCDMLRSSATTANVAEISCDDLGMKLLSAFRVPQSLYTSILDHIGGAMLTTHGQIEHIK
eukprot:12933581-Prorocentrum_lima.AAC.1